MYYFTNTLIIEVMISIKNLNFNYGKNKVFSNLDLNIECGKIYGLLGENGVGKTTLLKLISGLLPVKKGSCTVCEHIPYNREVHFIRTLTFVSLFITPFILYGFINHKFHGVNYTLIPATVLEKLISIFIVSSVIVPVVIFCGAIVTDTVLVLATPSTYKGYLFASSGILSNSGSTIVKVFGSFFLISSTALYGNLLFRKNKMLMTILSVIGINMLLMVVMIILIKSGLDLSEWIKNYSVNNGGQVVITMGKPSGLLVDVNRTVNIIFFILIPSALYTASYFRLKRIRF